MVHVSHFRFTSFTFFRRRISPLARGRGQHRRAPPPLSPLNARVFPIPPHREVHPEVNERTRSAHRPSPSPLLPDLRVSVSMTNLFFFVCFVFFIGCCTSTSPPLTSLVTFCHLCVPSSLARHFSGPTAAGKTGNTSQAAVGNDRGRGWKRGRRAQP